MANYTTNGSGAMNWSNGARWTNTDNSSTGVVPGASDVATIASGHTVTLDQNVTNLGGLAISGGLTWGTAGKTLRMAGDFSISGAGIATFGPNGVLEFDNAGRIWSNLGNWSPPYASVRTSGTTATERFTVRTDTGGTNAYMTAGSRYFLVSFVHVDFLRVGSSSTLAVDATGVTVGEAAAIDDATFEQCGDIWFSGMTDGGLVSDVKFIASLGPLNLQLKDATGVTTVNRCSFDKAPSLSGRGSVYTNNCFHAGFAAAYATTPWSVFDGNLVLQANSTGFVLNGGMTNSLWIVNNPAASADSGIVTSATDHTLTDSSKTWTLDQFSSANPHWMVYITGGAGAGQARRAASNTATTITFTGPSWKTPLDATSTYSIKQGFTYGSQTGIGNGMFDNTTPTVVDGNVWWNIHSDIGGICIAGVSTNRDYLITRNLFLRSLGMNNPGVALQLYSDAPRVSLEHNTFFSGDLAFVQYSPTGETPAGVIKSVRSNLVWCDPDDTTSYTSTYGPRIITQISHAADPENGTLDVVMAGMADYNGDWGLKSGNAGTGYAGNFSVTPGIHDVSGDPGFVNQDASPLTWAAANSYTASVNPLTQLDDFLAAIWADPARIKTSVLPYLRAAMTTTNANLATAAHDGTTIGAVELPSLPAAPSSLTATVVSSTQINLTWTDNSGNETGFALERSLDGTSSWTSINSPTTNTTSYSDTGLASSTAYFYRIKAVNDKGSSSYSSTATATTSAPTVPVAPSNLTAATVSSIQINLAWTDNSDDETGFTIERSPNGSSGWTQIASPIANATSYNDTGLTAGTAYFYRIKATNGVGSSTPTATATATTYAAPTVPAAPSDLGATVVSSSQVNLTWTDNSDNETGFILEQSPNGSSGWTQIASPAANANSYNATGLIAETLYFYRIKAVNDTGSSAYSTTATATTTKAPDANSPTNLQGVAPSDFDVFLTWDRANDNETSVLVDRSGDGGSTWNNVATLPSGENLWFDRSLWPGTTYKWRVRVEIDGQVSSPSETVAVTTMTSDAFRISFGTSTGIFTLPSDAAVANLDRWTNQLSFTDPNTGYKGQWNIDRSSDGGVTYQNLWMIPNTGTATTWTDRYLTPGQSYLYRMRLESPDYGLTDFMGPFSATTPSLGDLPAAATALCVNTYQLDLGGATTGAFALTIRDGMHGSFSATTPSLPFNSTASAVRDALRALCTAWTNDRNLPCDVVVAQTGAGVFLIGLTDGALLVQGVIASGDGVLTITERQTATNMTLLWEDHTGGAASYKVETGQQIWPTDANYDSQWTQVGTTTAGVTYFDVTTTAESYYVVRVRPHIVAGDGGYCVPVVTHTPSAGSALILSVGPGETYTSLGTVPWTTVGPGSVISLAYGTYNELIMIGVRGTLTRPIVIQGTMSGDNRPVLNGVGATTNAQFKSPVYDGFGVLMILNRNLDTGFYGTNSQHGWCAGNLFVKNLELTGAYRGDSGGLGCTNSSGAAVAYDYGSAGLYCAGGENLYFENLYIHGNGNGVFGLKGSSGNNTFDDMVGIPGRNLVVRNCEVNLNGNPGHPYEHELYIETDGLLVEGCRLGPAYGGGNAFKTRSGSLVFRYNVINGSGPGAHLLDLIEPENHRGGYYTLPDTQKEDWIYGNAIYNPPIRAGSTSAGSASPIHIGGDKGTYSIYKRIVRWYANTYLIRRDSNQPDSYTSTVFVGRDNGYARATRAAIDARRNIFHAIPDLGTVSPMVLCTDWSSGYFHDNSCVPGWTSGLTNGLIAGLANITTITDPKFADMTSNPPDLRLTADSPGIDAVTGRLSQITINRQPASLTTVARTMTGSAFDLGAFEFLDSDEPPPDEPPPDEPPPDSSRYRRPAKWVPRKPRPRHR